MQLERPYRWAAPVGLGRVGETLGRWVGALVVLAVGAGFVWVLTTGSAGTQQVAGLVLLGLAGAIVLVVVAHRPTTAVLVAWVIFVLQQPLGAYAGGVSSHAGVVVGRLDDVAIILLGAALIVRRLSRRPVLRGYGMLPAVVLASLAATGVVSAALAGTVGHWTLVGAWLSLKIWIIILVVGVIPWEPGAIERVNKWILITAVVVAAFAVLDYLSPATLQTLLHTPPEPVDPLEPSRAHYVQSVFASASRYSNFMTVAFTVALTRYMFRRKQSYLALSLGLGLAGLASLRLRGLLAGLAVAGVLIWLPKARRLARSVQVVGTILVCIAIVGPAAFEAQLTRFTADSGSTARGQLYGQAVSLASSNFPFGVGYGRYGSYASILYYSPIYDQTGMSAEWGFSRQNPNFLTDTTWAGYIGETGALGTLIVGVGLLLVGRRMVTVARRSPSPRAREAATLALALLVAAITMSVGSAALLDSVVLVAFAMAAGCALAESRAAPQGQASEV
jgi:hypothetical protein